jgi:hypothetical protein
MSRAPVCAFMQAGDAAHVHCRGMAVVVWLQQSCCVGGCCVCCCREVDVAVCHCPDLLDQAPAGSAPDVVRRLS